jgi:replicative DNA helicase
MGKCLAWDSEIVLSDGSVATIEEIHQTRNARLLTLDADLKLQTTSPSDFVDDGLKPVFRVTTRLGRSVETTLTHPFLTIEGWQPLAELQAGAKIAMPRKMPVFGSETMRDCEVKLLAYLIGDGCLVTGSPVFTVGKPALRDDFVQAVEDFGGVETKPANSPNRTFSLRIRRRKEQPGKDNPVTIWLKQLGLHGAKSEHKFVPAQVFRLPRRQLALFLNRLFATDGWATVLSSGQVQFGYASASERLARQVQHLLLRFGVVAALKSRGIKYRGQIRTAWQLDVTDAHSLRAFIHNIGICGKEKAVNSALAALEAKKYQTNRDLIPAQIWTHIATAKGTQSWASVARKMGLGGGNTNLHVGRRAPSRSRLLSLATAVGSLRLQKLAKSDVYWDEIVSIEPQGTKQVYDLTIPDTHNFIANDICVHNTSLCLNIAQNSAIFSQAVVAVFSLEMSKESLVMRMLSSEARVDAHRFRSGYLSKDEWGRLGNALGVLSEARIFIDDTPGLNILEMRAKLRRLATEQKKLDLVIVDYLQLMAGSRRTESRQQEVSQISRELKAVAKEFRVPVVALSQLSRASETRTDHKPVLSDLRESGSLEQDADVVGFIFREEQYNRTEENAGMAEFIIAKQRNGPTGTVKMAFLKEFTRFENLWKE